MNTSNVSEGVPARQVGRGTGNRPAKIPRAEYYAARNRECAEIILRDIQRFGGLGSLMVIWAEAVVRGQERQAREWRLVA